MAKDSSESFKNTVDAKTPSSAVGVNYWRSTRLQKHYGLRFYIFELTGGRLEHLSPICDEIRGEKPFVVCNEGADDGEFLRLQRELLLMPLHCIPISITGISIGLEELYEWSRNKFSYLLFSHERWCKDQRKLLNGHSVLHLIKRHLVQMST